MNLLTNAISWRNVAAAIEYYEQRGFQYVEVPWVVSDAAIAATMPAHLEATRCQDGALVGSAEQSFVQLLLDKKIGAGRYVAATPCFRDERPSILHRRYFFKVEICHIVHHRTALPDNCAYMAELALGFFQTLPGGQDAVIVPTPDGLDIELGGIELGSYGQRSLDEHTCWVYGTGYADPRFTQAAHAGR